MFGVFQRASVFLKNFADLHSKPHPSKNKNYQTVMYVYSASFVMSSNLAQIKRSASELCLVR